MSNLKQVSKNKGQVKAEKAYEDIQRTVELNEKIKSMTNSNKPASEIKEFSLHEEGLWYGAEELPSSHPEVKFHVVEMSAYSSLLAENEWLKYAAKQNVGDLEIKLSELQAESEKLVEALRDYFDNRPGGCNFRNKGQKLKEALAHWEARKEKV